MSTSAILNFKLKQFEAPIIKTVNFKEYGVKRLLQTRPVLVELVTNEN